METETIEKSKPVKRLKKLLTVGNIWLYVLSLIKKKGKHYAYALDDDIEKNFFFKPSKVMVYLVLYKLEGEGMIESHMEERRKYYIITKKGEETLETAREYFGVLKEKL
ncbi:PadR family transcriptional regulator [Candidatus Micrarchaeota archaeon]|nr:PadR family transcriptional regulator [Candidatus Micrarchaeota archaeon]